MKREIYVLQWNNFGNRLLVYKSFGFNTKEEAQKEADKRNKAFKKAEDKHNEGKVDV